MKILWKILKTLLILAIIGGLCYLGYTYYLSQKGEAKATTASYTQSPITKGDLQKTVTGTGSLSISEKKKVSLDFDVQIDEMLVQSGEAVSVGTPLATVNQDALSDTIDTLTTEITDLDSSMASAGSSYADTAYVKSAVAGRVKAVYCEKGDQTKEVVAAHGGLLLLSVDEMMQVAIETSELKVGETVKVLEGRYTYTGSVEKVENGKAIITFPDTRTLIDAEVTVTVNSAEVGSGKAEVHLPFVCSTTVEGYISTVYPSINSQVAKKGNILYVTNIPQTAEYKSLIKQRNEKLAILNAAKKIQLTGVIESPVEGIVNTTTEASLTAITAKTEIASIYVGGKMQMTISVDELDISGVRLEQEVQIAMDSVQDKTYGGTVAYISQIGTSSSGVTTYSVTLDVTSDTLLKMGMNGTATIVVDEVKDVVLVPVSALYTMRNKQYVWLYSQEETQSGTPGVMTFVETGFSNDSYAEVKSGLNVGDVVLVMRTGSDSATNSMMMTNMNFGAVGGGETMITMPAGGDGPTMRQNNSNGGGNANWGGGQRNGN